MQGTRLRPRAAPAALLALLLAACSLVSSYDPVSHRLATDLKTESLLLMASASEPAAAHAAEIRGLRLRLAQALEYERSKGEDNADTAALWEILLDPDAALIVAVLDRWSAEGALGAAFLREKRAQIAAAFDQIIRLESAKARS